MSQVYEVKFTYDNGNLSVQVGWPDSAPEGEAIGATVGLLSAINDGKLTSLCVEAILESKHPAATQIVNEWRRHAVDRAKVRTQPVILPRKLFRVGE